MMAIHYAARVAMVRVIIAAHTAYTAANIDIYPPFIQLKQE